jgi:HEPN domain-containing protein
MRPETDQWLAMANDEWAAAAVLFGARRWSSSVFQVHLAVEKLLKGLVNEAIWPRSVPYSHHLPLLVAIAEIQPEAEMAEFLAKLSPQSVAARYPLSPDDYSESVCDEIIKAADEAMKWLRQHLR